MIRRIQFLITKFRPMAFVIAAVSGFATGVIMPAAGQHNTDNSRAVQYKAPAGTLPATQHVQIGSFDAAVLPTGRFVTPLGVEVEVGAPKPFGMAVSRDAGALATINSGVGPFSITVISGLNTPSPQAKLIPVNATFLGVIFSPDGARFYAAGGENGNIWVGDTASGQIIGSVNLNGTSHPTGGMNVVNGPTNFFKGTFPGRLAISSDGHYLYTTDQGGFQVHVIDTTKILTGVDNLGNLSEPDNFAAAAASVKVGRYPFGIALAADNTRLYVTNVGVFQYTSLLPANPTGDKNIDFPLCYPGAGYPNETESDRLVKIRKVDPRNLPNALSFRDGIGCGYVSQDQDYVVPGLGSPNALESSSVYVFDASNPVQPMLLTVVKTGPEIANWKKESRRTPAAIQPRVRGTFEDKWRQPEAMMKVRAGQLFM